MTKKEAYTEMLKGNKVTNQYFTPNEYLHCPENSNGRIFTEDGYHMSNYWNHDYLPNVKWEIYNEQ